MSKMQLDRMDEAWGLGTVKPEGHDWIVRAAFGFLQDNYYTPARARELAKALAWAADEADRLNGTQLREGSPSKIASSWMVRR